MALTNHEKIRKEAGFQHTFTRVAFINSPDGGATTFFLETDDPVKLVPEFGTGATVAGVSDIEVWCGLSAQYGSSQMTVTSINVDTGAVTLDTAPDDGCSLIVTHSSSSVTSKDIESIRRQAESIVNQRMSLCYDLPLTSVPASVESLATRMASALLLTRGYGTGSRNTSADGYALYEQMLGNGQVNTEESELVNVGEIGMVCRLNYQLVDDNGVVILRNDEDKISGGQTYVAGGKGVGRIYDITEEPFRKKDYQIDVDRNQPGSDDVDPTKTQG